GRGPTPTCRKNLARAGPGAVLPDPRQARFQDRRRCEMDTRQDFEVGVRVAPIESMRRITGRNRPVRTLHVPWRDKQSDFLLGFHTPIAPAGLSSVPASLQEREVALG